LFKKSDAPVVAGGKISNILGPDTSYKGTLKSDGNIRVDGVFEGLIETAGNVVIGPSAKVLADIIASSVQVWGAVRGNITAQGRLEILSTGRVWGDVKVSSMLIDEGGMFRGQCFMMAEDVEPPTFAEEHKEEKSPLGIEAKTEGSEALATAKPEEPAEGQAHKDVSTEQPEALAADAGTSEQPAAVMMPASTPKSRRRSSSAEKGAF